MSATCGASFSAARSRPATTSATGGTASPPSAFASGAALGRECSDALAERRRAVELRHADSLARRRRLVGRPDAAQRRSDLAGAGRRLARRVEQAVVGEDDLRAVGERADSRRSRRPAARTASISESSASGSTTTPGPMTSDAPADDSGREQVKREVPVAELDRVAGVVAAVVAGDDRRSGRREDRRSSPCPRRPTVRREPPRHCTLVHRSRKNEAG